MVDRYVLTFMMNLASDIIFIDFITSKDQTQYYLWRRFNPPIFDRIAPWYGDIYYLWKTVNGEEKYIIKTRRMK